MFGVEGVGVDAGEEFDDVVWFDAEVDEALGVVCASAEDTAHGFVEPRHPLCGDPGHGLIVEEVVDVCGKVGVVCAEDGDVVFSGPSPSCEADGAGGGDVDDVGVEGCCEFSDVGCWWYDDVERCVAGHWSCVDWFEIVNVWLWRACEAC